MKSLSSLKASSTFFLLSVLLATLPNLAFAANVYIGNVKSSDGDGQVTQSVNALMGASVNSAGGNVVESESSADYTLKADIVKLGPAIVLTVSRWKSGRQQFAARQKANTISELDDATDRAVRAAMIGSPTKKDTRVGEVSEKEKHEMQTRIKSKNSVYLAFGPGYFNNMGTTQLSYDFALGYVWGVAPQWDVKTVLDSVISNDWKTSIISGSLGLDYYLTDADSAPYVTGGFGLGLSGSTYSSVTTIGGFQGQFGLGYQLFRTSSTQFDLSLVYNSIFLNNTIGSPGFYAFRIGVFF